MSGTKRVALLALVCWLSGFARLGTCADAFAVETVKVFVATTGNDDNPGTEEKPVARLVRAQALAREAAAKADPKESTVVEVVLRGGTYRLTTPLVITPEDRGQATLIRYAAAAKEAPVTLSGGEEIRGWKAVGDVWQ